MKHQLIIYLYIHNQRCLHIIITKFKISRIDKNHHNRSDGFNQAITEWKDLFIKIVIWHQRLWATNLFSWKKCISSYTSGSRIIIIILCNFMLSHTDWKSLVNSNDYEIHQNNIKQTIIKTCNLSANNHRVTRCNWSQKIVVDKHGLIHSKILTSI